MAGSSFKAPNDQRHVRLDSVMDLLYCLTSLYLGSCTFYCSSVKTVMQVSIMNHSAINKIQVFDIAPTSVMSCISTLPKGLVVNTHTQRERERESIFSPIAL